MKALVIPASVASAIDAHTYFIATKADGDAGRGFWLDLRQTLLDIAQRPGVGDYRPDLTDEAVRFVRYGIYQIAYSELADCIVVRAVVQCNYDERFRAQASQRVLLTPAPLD